MVFATFSRPFFQPVFENLLNLSLKAMNIGDGHDVRTSGEKIVFDLVNNLPGDETLTIFDVGAHTGEWVGLLKKHCTRKFRAFCFEPSATSFSELENVADDRFHLEQLAFGNVSGKKYLAYEHDGDSTAQVRDNKETGRYEEIKVCSIDDYCSRNKIDRIDLLKMDVEGYELNIIKGACDMLINGKIGLIQFEFGAKSEERYSLGEFFNLLEGQYKICRILRHGCYHLKEYRHYYEIMTVTNFIAIKK